MLGTKFKRNLPTELKNELGTSVNGEIVTACKSEPATVLKSELVTEFKNESQPEFINQSKPEFEGETIFKNEKFKGDSETVSDPKIELKNELEKQFKCEICYSNFAYGQNLRKHVASVHECNPITK